MNDTKYKQTLKLKSRQKEIITHLVRFRYLNRLQIQTILHHKSRVYIINWLNELVYKQYLFRFYEKEIAAKPSEYCLDKGCITYLRNSGIPERILKRIYKEKSNSKYFRDHTIFIANVYLSLESFTKSISGNLHFYTKEDLHAINYLILPYPDCYFAIISKNKKIKRYFLDYFDDNSFLKMRVYQYLNYYKNRYWQNHTTKPFPEIIFICPDEISNKNIARFIQKHSVYDAPAFYLTTKKDVLEKGMCKEILKKVDTQV